ncbi:hypothetical protein AAHE18_15G219400 [Arachis hypogaea]
MINNLLFQNFSFSHTVPRITTLQLNSSEQGILSFSNASRKEKNFILTTSSFLSTNNLALLDCLLNNSICSLTLLLRSTALTGKTSKRVENSEVTGNRVVLKQQP